MRFIVMGMATRESEAGPPPTMDVEDFGDEFTPTRKSPR
jgi:hypothetical protein